MIELILPGMTCGGCARGVTAAIKSLDPAADVVTDVAARKVQVTTTIDAEAVKNAVRNAGYVPACDQGAVCSRDRAGGNPRPFLISPA